MASTDYYKEKIAQNGFTVIDDVFTVAETDAILQIIAAADTSGPAFRKTDDLFAIRQVLQVIPEIYPVVFTPRFKALIASMIGGDYFVIKSIYFDKPAASNWFVAWHQDLTISVDRKSEIERFRHWTVKQGQFAVQPPQEILDNNCTIRIHLDDTDENNGALRIIPGSHLRGVVRMEELSEGAMDVSCAVRKGGIMLMKPLLMHSSGRTVDERARRVLHIEFGRDELPEGLNWSEKTLIR